jgi:Domain of Unknown Function (DUF1080)
MVNRRSFAKQVVGYLPVFATLASSTQASQAQQPGAAPPGGRGGGGRGQMDGSPLGDPIPGQKWRVHDRERPQPRKVTPGQPISTPSAPSDAIVLFDGKDLSKWNAGAGRGSTAVTEPQWKIVDGHAEMRGGIVTKESFGDIQLHVEWTTPPVGDATRVGQFRGNSGVIFMGGRYEVQVLSSYDNPTYPDGAAGGIYGVYPPMVNPCMPEGQWNSFDFVFEAPKFDGEKLAKPAFITLFFNGVMVHNKAQLLGTTSHEPIAVYTPHPPELPLSLQGHVGPAWYRNIWVRRLLGYDA